MALQSWFVLENGKVNEVPNLTDIITEQHSVYITTQKQQEHYNHVKAFVDAANELIDTDSEAKNNGELISDAYRYVRFRDGKYVVDAQQIKEMI